MAKKLNYTYAVGRRKEAKARVRLFHGKGKNLVNGISIEKYFPGKVMELIWKKPFELSETYEKYYVTVKVKGGGSRGQLDAVVLGISRALASVKERKYRQVLKKQGLLTRDSRIRERRKVGMGGKARRKKQSPKR